MEIQINRVDYRAVEGLRELYRQEANCQIVRDSLLGRGLADPYLILAAGRVAGYGAVRNRQDVGRLSEFYTLPYARPAALTLCRELMGVSGATHLEAQTNQFTMLSLLYDCTINIKTEAILFHDASVTALLNPHACFRQLTHEEKARVFPHYSEPVGDWGIEAEGEIVATGGFLCHYNPPYADLYMEVKETARRQGHGSFLLQEVKRLCYEAGKKPSARTDAANFGSRKTLERAGFEVCGRLLVGEISSVT